MRTIAPDYPIDFLSVDFYLRDPYDAYAWLRDQAPVYWDEANDLWAITRHADVTFVSSRPDLFCSGQGFRPGMGPDGSLVSLDPPRHTHIRRLINRGFTPRMVAQLETHTRELVDQTLDNVAARGHCDFVHDIAMPLPMLVIAELLGVPLEDWHKLQRWSDDMNVALSGEGLEIAMQAYADYCDYFAGVHAEKSAQADDCLVSKLIHAEVEGERLSYDDVLRTTLLLLVGGNETTRNTVAGAMLALTQHPDQHAALRDDPSRLPLAIEEFLRWVTPIMNFRRTATRDTELHGQTIRAGQQVLILYGAANRDERVFRDPDRFDIGRHPNDHLAFGIGTHFCLGANLARLEIRVMFEELLRRFPDIHLAANAAVARYPSTFIRGWSTLPIEFTPQRSAI